MPNISFVFLLIFICFGVHISDAGIVKNSNLKFLIGDRKTLLPGEPLRFDVKLPAEFTMYDFDDLNLYLWNTIVIKTYNIENAKIQHSKQFDNHLSVEFTIPVNLARFAGDKFRICFEDIERSKQIGCSRKLEMLQPKVALERKSDATKSVKVAVTSHNPFDDDSLGSWKF